MELDQELVVVMVGTGTDGCCRLGSVTGGCYGLGSGTGGCYGVGP